MLLHPNQCGLGAVLIVSLRHVASVGKLNVDEAADFHRLFVLLEPALEKVFGASLVNVSCDRNWAFRKANPNPPFFEGRPNPHVHWHVVPRYPRKISFDSVEWSDTTFGEPFVWRKKAVPLGVRVKIIRAIRRKLPISFVKKANQSTDPAFASGTFRAGHEPRHRLRGSIQR